jgi:hypothetical protein
MRNALAMEKRRMHAGNSRKNALLGLDAEPCFGGLIVTWQHMSPQADAEQLYLPFTSQG